MKLEFKLKHVVNAERLKDKYSGLEGKLVHVNAINCELYNEIAELKSGLSSSTENTKLMQSIIDGFVNGIQHLQRNLKKSANEVEYIIGRIDKKK